MNYNEEHNDDDLNSLLPFGENIRPLITASGLSENDLRFLLQKRGVFVKNHQRNNTVPLIASLLLSPKEFEILRNRQHKKESNIKRSTGRSEWNGKEEKLVDTISPQIETIVKNLVENNLSYSINKFNVTNEGHDKIIIEGEIKRNDWTKDVFSIETFHTWKLTIEKLPDNNMIEYVIESTVPETKELLSKLQNQVQKELQAKKVVAPTQKIQKVLATHFKKNQFIFEYLLAFTKRKFETLTFQRIVDIETGIDNKLNFPDNFKWLKNIGEVKLTAMQGKKLEETDVIEIGKLGILIFGEIDAEFNFSSSEVAGSCVIQYGFPKFYDKKNHIEFETKILKIDLKNEFAHISKENVKKKLLAEFQKEKHNIFDEFKTADKADANDKDLDNNYLIAFPIDKD
ncbi:MAG: hypothetical protein JNL70_07505 [Saprospiraceae bacterium]|nr:hypothetical protein [Saprospiraceae bacterium]